MEAHFGELDTGGFSDLRIQSLTMRFQVLQDFIHGVIKTGFYHRSILPLLLLDAVDRSLERSASLECWLLGCLDLQLCTSSRVAADACCALSHFERTETNQCHVVACFQGGGDDFNQCCDVAICVRLGAASLVCQCINQFFTVHVIAPFGG